MQKWVIMRHELYQSLATMPPAASAAAPTAQTAQPLQPEPAVSPADQHGRAPPRPVRNLQLMLADNELIGWPDDRLTLYGHETGRSAAQLLTGLNRKVGRVQVAEKIVLQILAKTGWTRADYAKAGLVNVWNKVKKFRRDNA